MDLSSIWSFVFLLTWCHVLALAVTWVAVLTREPWKMVVAHGVSLLGHMVPIAGGGLVLLLVVATFGLPPIWAAPLALAPFALIAALRFELSGLGALGRRVNEITAALTVVLAVMAVFLG